MKSFELKASSSSVFEKAPTASATFPSQPLWSSHSRAAPLRLEWWNSAGLLGKALPPPLLLLLVLLSTTAASTGEYWQTVSSTSTKKMKQREMKIQSGLGETKSSEIFLRSSAPLPPTHHQPFTWIWKDSCQKVISASLSASAHPTDFFNQPSYEL